MFPSSPAAPLWKAAGIAATAYEGAADRRREVPIDEIPYDEPAASISPAEAACTVQELWGSGVEMNLPSLPNS